jgi:hypothetical protein
MSDVTATLRVESPDPALTETVAYDDAATVQPVAGAGTVPNLGAYLFTVSLERVCDYASPVGTEPGLTRTRREAILLALEMGYFEEPRGATLGEVAAELGISRPAAGGLLRRGLRRLVVSTVAVEADGTEDER